MKYVLLVFIFCVSAMASDNSDESCQVTIKAKNKVYRGTVGVMQIENTGKFRLIYYDNDTAKFSYDEGTPIEYTGKDIEDLKPDFCVPYLGKSVCSKVKKVTSFEPDHEDSPAIIHYLDEKGNLLGRVGGFPGLAAICK
jgi:hypothetical protein